MKLYSNKINGGAVEAAFFEARTLDGQDIYAQDLRAFVPRNFQGGVEFYAFSYSGKRASAHRPIGSYDVVRAASWEAYGFVIARLYQRDPDAVISYYGNQRDFVRQIQDELDRPRPRGDGKFLELLA